MFAKVLVVVFTLGVAKARFASFIDDNLLETSTVRTDNSSKSTIGTYLNGLRYAQKVYRECSNEDLSSCLKLKLIGILDNFSKVYKEVPLINGVTFVRESNEITEETISVNQIEATLPRSLNEKEEALNGIILNKIMNFFQTHKLQIKLPSIFDSESESNSTEEGRARRRRNNSLLMLPLILAGTLVPIALGGLALFAGKALLVSKLALVLASIIGLKKLLGGGDHEKPQEVYISAGHGYDSGHSRSYRKDAQNLAYNAYQMK